MYLFVYGTLKKGYGNNVLLKDSEFLGTRSYLGNFGLIDLGSFPGAVQINAELEIKGELYKITPDTLKDTDYLEGYPSFYNRKLIEISPEKIMAWIYYLNNKTRVSNAEIITEWNGPIKRRA